MHIWERTGGLKPIANGLTDFIAEGRYLRGDEWIPCEIGYTGYYSNINGKGQAQDYYYMEPSHIFVKEGITDSGNHYDAETIEL